MPEYGVPSNEGPVPVTTTALEKRNDFVAVTTCHRYWPLKGKTTTTPLFLHTRIYTGDSGASGERAGITRRFCHHSPKLTGDTLVTRRPNYLGRLRPLVGRPPKPVAGIRGMRK